MGLDMYLEKDTYIGGHWEHRRINGIIEIKQAETPIKIDLNKVASITEMVGTWRKANQIHGWFVEKVQGGVDECQRSEVSYEQLMDLKQLCERVINTKEAGLLPPKSGFFFGSGEIDEYYWQDLKDTIDILSNLDPNGDYYYQASW